MRKKVTLITGVSGEVGLALVKNLSELGYNNLLTLDIRPLPTEYTKYSSHIQGDILDKSLLNRTDLQAAYVNINNHCYR